MSRFSKWKYPVIFGGLVIVIVLLIVVLRPAWGGLQQPLPFNHKLHADNGLECIDCHRFFRDQAFSGKPELETCSGCHNEPLGESAAEKILLERIRQDQEIQWQRLYRLPQDVYFSHRRHTVLGAIECRACHGEIGSSTSPPSKPVKITMTKCMSCHEKNKVNNDCISCHR